MYNNLFELDQLAKKEAERKTKHRFLYSLLKEDKGKHPKSHLHQFRCSCHGGVFL